MNYANSWQNLRMRNTKLKWAKISTSILPIPCRAPKQINNLFINCQITKFMEKYIKRSQIDEFVTDQSYIENIKKFLQNGSMLKV